MNFDRQFFFEAFHSHANQQKRFFERWAVIKGDFIMTQNSFSAKNSSSIVNKNRDKLKFTP